MKVFVIAMDKEARPIVEQMTGVSEEIVNNKRIIRGQLYKNDVAIVICGIGKVNAACGTQYAIDALLADEIINVGVAGGLNGGVEVGKIYGVSHAVQYDFDLASLNGTKIGTLDECTENYLPLALTAIYPLKKLGTGDRFNDSSADFELLTKELGADIRDMECGAIVQACMHAGVKCRSYKIISDLAGSGSTAEQYFSNLTLCFETLMRELKNITEEIYGKDSIVL